MHRLKSSSNISSTDLGLPPAAHDTGKKSKYGALRPRVDVVLTAGAACSLRYLICCSDRTDCTASAATTTQSPYRIHSGVCRIRSLPLDGTGSVCVSQAVQDSFSFSWRYRIRFPKKWKLFVDTGSAGNMKKKWKWRIFIFWETDPVSPWKRERILYRL